jgi:hypothetical protein
VPITAVADDIDDNVLLVLGAIVGSELTNERQGLDIVAVYMEDGCIDGFCNVGGVRGGASESRISREANLIIDDQVNGTANAIRWEIVHPQCFVYDTLSGESGITMKKNGHRRIMLFFVVSEKLESASLSDD